MSELMATTAQEIVQNEKDCDYMDELFGGVKMPPTQVYLKSEADKVIEEKDEIIDELKEHIDELQKATDSAWSKVNAIYDELCHQNYKRCLAMAMWCESEMNYWYDSTMREQCPRFKFYEKWYKRWLELAEEPTLAKFLQLIHKEVK